MLHLQDNVLDLCSDDKREGESKRRHSFLFFMFIRNDVFSSETSLFASNLSFSDSEAIGVMERLCGRKATQAATGKRGIF
jgi:hypothetical protein